MRSAGWIPPLKGSLHNWSESRERSIPGTSLPKDVFDSIGRWTLESFACPNEPKDVVCRNHRSHRTSHAKYEDAAGYSRSSEPHAGRSSASVTPGPRLEKVAHPRPAPSVRFLRPTASCAVLLVGWRCSRAESGPLRQAMQNTSPAEVNIYDRARYSKYIESADLQKSAD